MSYRVVVTREDGNWLANVPELQGAHTWARTLRSLDGYVREVVVLAADLPDEAMDSLELTYDYQTGDHVIDERAAAVREARQQLEELEERVTLDTRDVVQWAVEHGYSVRDTAELAGVSPQRVSQLRRNLRDA